ncbi:ABC transporter permease [Canibacter sp. lx-72]|uniref:ABC transporter permease n=1 Tax=Canibacter zhuwentaonis TaxID=2837491 RepID=UPI001BDC60B2|nr:ABC transporter permease [Canibacter zhuwentaonis]MBT1018129.1 ABC transporter permease [Canibacter zhuwentaonis]MBT1035336.1 ABC transporter permease [Canibacter zhuwentaonis]
MKRFMRQYLPAFVAVLLVILAWDLVTRFSDLPEYLLPSPGRVAAVLYEDYAVLAPHLKSTLFIATAGFIVGAVQGVVVSMLFGLVDPLRRALEPLLVATQAIPPVIIAPLVITLYGFGVYPKITVVALTVFFPIVIGGAQALRNADSAKINLLRAMGANRFQMLWWVRFPSAFPALIAGLKISASYVVFSAIVAEWMGSTAGLGVYLQRSQASYQTAQMFAAVILIAVTGLILFTVVSLIGNLILRKTRQLSSRKVTG